MWKVGARMDKRAHGSLQHSNEGVAIEPGKPKVQGNTTRYVLYSKRMRDLQYTVLYNS